MVSKTGLRRSMRQERVRVMDNPPGSLPAQRRTTLVTFLVLLISVMVITVLMVLPYVLAVTMGGILALLSQPVFQWLKGHHVKPRVAAAVVVLGVVLVLIAPLFIVTKAIQQGIAIGQGLAEGGFSLRSLLDHVSGWVPIETMIGNGTGSISFLSIICYDLPLAVIECYFQRLAKQVSIQDTSHGFENRAA